eukprot:3773133-Amphidinium_carterae.1
MASEAYWRACPCSCTAAATISRSPRSGSAANRKLRPCTRTTANTTLRSLFQTSITSSKARQSFFFVLPSAPLASFPVELKCHGVIDVRKSHPYRPISLTDSLWSTEFYN